MSRSDSRPIDICSMCSHCSWQCGSQLGQIKQQRDQQQMKLRAVVRGKHFSGLEDLPDLFCNPTVGAFTLSEQWGNSSDKHLISIQHFQLLSTLRTAVEPQPTIYTASLRCNLLQQPSDSESHIQAHNRYPDTACREQVNRTATSSFHVSLKRLFY